MLEKSPVTLLLNRLNCVLRATDAADVDTVTDGLRVSARVGDITTCRTDTELRSELQQRSSGNMPDFVVLVASHPELPPCLLRYPDLRVLVLTTHRKIGSLTPWLQQGASDVASLARPQQMQHALGRIIDESAMERRVGLLATELVRSEARYTSLVRNSQNALSFWRDDELLSCSPSFSDITGLREGASTTDWLQTLQENSRAQLGQSLNDFPKSARAVVSTHKQTIRMAREPLCDAADDNEHLISVKLVLQRKTAVEKAVEPEAVKTASKPTPAIQPPETAMMPSPSLSPAQNGTALNSDSVSGLPARQTVVKNFQRWLQGAEKNSRYVAMTVDLSSSELVEEVIEPAQSTPNTMPMSSGKKPSDSTNTERTLQNLAVFRAADRLTRLLSSNTLLGRLNDDRLLIIRELEADEAPRMLAKGIRRSLGSLGGLLGSPEAVRINTVNISAKQGASAEGLVTRLENR